MDEPRNTTITGLLFSFCCCFYGSDDERSLLRTCCCFYGSDADSVDEDSQNWWRRVWNSIRRAGEWSGSVMDDAGCCACSGPKSKYLVRKLKTDVKTIYSSRPSRFQYDPPSYELNFDDGLRPGEDRPLQGLSLSSAKPRGSEGALNPRKALKDIQNLQVIRSRSP